MRKSWLIGLIFLLITSVLILSREDFHSQLPVTISLSSGPTSTDPIDYDLLTHHIAFRSVYSSVVNLYSLGRVEPVLIESWQSDRDYSEWTLFLRKGLKFENGDPIRTSDIVNSWLRIAHIMKSRNSKSGLFEKLVGFEKWKGLGSSIPGLTATEDTISLRFNAGFRNFLEIVSFGLYAVVHPSCYNPQNGEWRDPKCLISSGPYKINSWNEEKLELELRPGFSKPGSLHSITLKWSEGERLQADMLVGFSMDEELKPTREFYGTPFSQIGYVRCNSWSDKKGPCGSKERRQALRKLFYEHLGHRPDLSFFPLAIPGIHPFELDTPTNDQIPRSSKVRYRVGKLPSPPFVNFNRAFQAMEKEGLVQVSALEIPFNQAEKEFYDHLPKYTFDVISAYTGILIEAPKDDIRFMFLSKEGIRLPDTDGRITAELNKPDFDPQTINELLWDQAVIWPLAHFAMGFWAKKGLFDFSQINLTLPPTDFQYIRWK